MHKIKCNKSAATFCSFNKCRAKWMVFSLNVIGLSALYWKLVPTVGGIMAKEVTPLVLSESFSSPSLQNRSRGQGWIHI